METESSTPAAVLQLLSTLDQQPPPGDDAILDALTQLNILASNDTPTFRSVASNINVDVVFALVDRYTTQRSTTQRRGGSEEDYVSVTCCQLLRNVFMNMQTVDVMDRYGKYMNTEHANQSVSLLCLQQVLRLAEEGNFSYFMSSPNLIQFTIHFLCHENGSTEMSGVAPKILSKLTALSGNGWLFNDEFIRLFKHLISSKNAVTRFRIYDVFVAYITNYPEYMELCKQCGIFDDLIAIILHSDDVLVQLNALEILSQIATSGQKGLNFLQEKGIISWIGDTLAKSDSDPLVSFLLPGCVKFFGVLCASNPMEIIPCYKPILVQIFRGVHTSNDPTLSCLCAETVAFICSKGDGLKVLYGTEPDAIKETMTSMTQVVTNPGEDDYSREHMLQSLTSMFDHDVQDVELSQICEKLYSYLSATSPMAYIFKLAQLPFAEIRHGSFKLLGHVSKHSWVQQDMVLCPGFLEYLLDRKTETEKEGHELKFLIIQNLARSVTALDNFGPEYFEKLEKYCTEGAFYGESYVAVAVDGN